jgi:hypothetical protein
MFGERLLPFGERLLPFGERLLPFGELLLPSGAKVLYSCLLYNSVEVKMYKTVQLSVLCGCKTVCHMKGRV